MVHATVTVEGENERPPEHALPVRFVISPTMPAEYVTHIWVHDYGEAHHAYQLTLHRVEVPTRLEGDSELEEVQATCVARVVLSDATLKAMLLLLGRVAKERIGLEIREPATASADISAEDAGDD